MVDPPLDENLVSRFSHQQAIAYFNLYLKNTRILIENLTTDFQKGDIELIRAHAHKIKGSSIVIGAMRMKDLSFQIEEEARDKRKFDEKKLLQLKEQFAQLSNLLRIRYNIIFEQ